MDKLNDPKNLFGYLLTSHAPLINKTINHLRAKEWLPSAEVISDDDLHPAAIHGLMEAVSSYKPHLGSFKTHAFNRMKGRILDHAKHLDEIPHHIRADAKAYYKAQLKGLIPKTEED